MRRSSWLAKLVLWSTLVSCTPQYTPSLPLPLPVTEQEAETIADQHCQQLSLEQQTEYVYNRLTTPEYRSGPESECEEFFDEGTYSSEITLFVVGSKYRQSSCDVQNQRNIALDEYILRTQGKKEHTLFFDEVNNGLMIGVKVKDEESFQILYLLKPEISQPSKLNLYITLLHPQFIAPLSCTKVKDSKECTQLEQFLIQALTQFCQHYVMEELKPYTVPTPSFN